MQPEALFPQPPLKIWSDSVKNWRSYERRNQTMKEELIFIAIDPKCQGDLQGHMIFYMTLK